MANRKRRLRIVAAAGAGILLVLTSPLWGTYIGRKISWFEIHRVEFSGARLVAPHELLQSSGIHQGQNLFDDSAPWESALRAHPVITDVRITRRPPSTLRIRVEEKRPIALVGSEVLVMATGDGEILPVDPSAAPVDLPLVRGEMDDLVQAVSTRKVLAETARLTATDPRILAEISEIRMAPRETDVLLLVHPLGDILLPFGASESRLAELRAVLADLARNQPVAEGSRSISRASLDLRFDEQVVVRHPPPRELS